MADKVHITHCTKPAYDDLDKSKARLLVFKSIIHVGHEVRTGREQQKLSRWLKVVEGKPAVVHLESAKRHTRSRVQAKCI